jgi:hypothetical protein
MIPQSLLRLTTQAPEMPAATIWSQGLLRNFEGMVLTPGAINLDLLRANNTAS